MLRRRRASLLAPLLLAATVLGSCAAGPHQLRRTIDDWDRQLYVNSPWFNAALWVVPVIPVATIGGFTFDFLIGDPYAFWFGDAWDGEGTGFEHSPVEAVDGTVDSLLLDRSGWTRTAK